jgi:hypothetical protein
MSVRRLQLINHIEETKDTTQQWFEPKIGADKFPSAREKRKLALIANKRSSIKAAPVSLQGSQ